MQSFDFCGLITKHPLTIGLFEEGDLEREELVFFLLLFSWSIFILVVIFFLDLLFRFLESSYEHLCYLSDYLLDFVNLIKVPLPLEMSEPIP